MTLVTRVRYGRATLALSMALACLLSTLPGHAAAAPEPQRPNILFFIMDDVGIDQMRVFGYGGRTPPRTPNINAIAHAGVRFRNVWAMPECSPSRAMFFQGRYPLRTNVLNAIVSTDLANSQVSPFEVTTPRVLKKRHYASALFGKFHLAGPLNNPFGNKAPRSLGWDYFYGYLEGAPHPIDTTAGGVAPDETYACGFVSDATQGACYFADGRACTDTLPGATPGRKCMERGGVFVPDQPCMPQPPTNVTFQTLNGYYVSPLVINHTDGTVEEVSPTDPRARMYRTTAEVNAARDWIKQHRPNQRWMATVSFSSAHAPYQQPPRALLPPGSVNGSALDCHAPAAQRILSNQMIEAMDAEIGRLLVELGLARRTPTGRLHYRPEETNTMVIIIADNGTFAPSVKAPFDPQRSKGMVYQTGVWVPLIVAGPLVQAPDREVRHMVNVADLFALFGEIAGLDVDQVVPKTHTLDAVPMLPYLTDPDQESLRTSNFTQTGTNITANGVRPPPCVIESVNTCVQVFPQKALCEFETGTWWGPGADAAVTQGIPDTGLDSCCAVNQFRQAQGQALYDILPDAASAVRNKRFKLVQKTQPYLNVDTNACESKTVNEFYAINERANLPRLDREDRDLLQRGRLTPLQQQNFDALSAALQAILTSEPDCPGDGNLDKHVNRADVQNWLLFAGKGSSVYDLNFDGQTNVADLAIIVEHFRDRCLQSRPRSRVVSPGIDLP